MLCGIVKGLYEVLIDDISGLPGFVFVVPSCPPWEAFPWVFMNMCEVSQLGVTVTVPIRKA